MLWMSYEYVQIILKHKLYYVFLTNINKSLLHQDNLHPLYQFSRALGSHKSGAQKSFDTKGRTDGGVSTELLLYSAQFFTGHTTYGGAYNS